MEFDPPPFVGGKRAKAAIGGFAFLAVLQVAALSVLLSRFSSADPRGPILEDVSTEASMAAALRISLLGPGGLVSESTNSNRLSETFSGSQSTVALFNNQGVDDAFRSEFAPLRAFFDKARDPDANAFVLNTMKVAGEPCPPAELEGDWDPEDTEYRKAAVGLHVDTTVGIDSMRSFIAHSVHVLYVSVPDDIGDSGHLEFFDLKTDYRSEPAMSVAPVQDRMIRFRGDAVHRINWYCGSAPRVSVVLESYRIPYPFDRFTYHFLVNDKYARLGIPNEEMEDYALSALVVTFLCMVLIFIANSDFELPKPETASAKAAPPAEAVAGAKTADDNGGLKQRKAAAR